jgi:hypothetical protein
MSDIGICRQLTQVQVISGLPITRHSAGQLQIAREVNHLSLNGSRATAMGDSEVSQQR